VQKFIDFSRVIHVCIHPVHHEAISNPPEADWPPAFSGGIGALFQILEIQEYSSGLKHGPAAILVRLWRIEPTRQRRV